MSDLVLFTNPQSRGRIAHWMMEELQLPYETVWLNYGPGMKTPDYLSINPMGKVPAIKHGSVVVTEAAAICAYLGDHFADKQLAPRSGSPMRAPYYRWLFFAAGPLEAAVTAKSMNWQVPGEKQGMVGFGSYASVIAALDAALSNGPYLCGEQFTAADVYVGSSLGWGMMFGTIEKRPAFSAYVERLYARPASQRANQLNEAQMKKTAS
jgi:glutathione S-transferase